MLRPLLLFIALITSHLAAADRAPFMELASLNVRFNYDCLPAAAMSAHNLIACKRDTQPQEPLTSEAPELRTWAPETLQAKDVQFGLRLEAETVSLRPVANGRVPALGLFRKRLSSRYSSGAWLQLQSGYGDVLVEDRVGRARMNGAGIQDPDFVYVKLCLKF